jgi:mRNA-degrading endonuclease RelE of RelBE toxin-antitoxin system
MMYRVLGSHTFRKQYNNVSKDMQKRIKKGLKELEKDPFNPRSGADIKPVKDTDPQKHRLRIGEYRLIYRVEGTDVKMVELFLRGRGYRD